MSRPRILLADDHPALLEATTALVETQFDVVGTATNGATLVSEALRLCPDVIVADNVMPVLSGIDAAHQLRESALSVKIVYLTIHSEEQLSDQRLTFARYRTALSIRRYGFSNNCAAHRP
ncbi:MAG TPA: response regulator transcription factor [Edaphobacter sp.]|nr:response regulator transcription factor [Edaphobacter sp.]